MFILQWTHTRTGKAMQAVFKTQGEAWVRVLMVRQVFPAHPFTLNGDPI